MGAMKRQGMVPDAFIYIAVICASIRPSSQSEPWDSLEATKRQGVVPDANTYNSLISACGKGKQPE